MHAPDDKTRDVANAARSGQDPMKPNARENIPVLEPVSRQQTLPDGSLRVFAPAKLNLDLLVGPRRGDGFHPLDSIVVKITLFDEILLRPTCDGQITLTCRHADCGPVEKNLACRAAKLLATSAGISADVGAEIELTKRIPPGKGLGGGSSDAASVLAGLDELWRLQTPPARLGELAAELGSDVPVFLGPPAARMTGRGEVLGPAVVHGFAAVLHLPDFACATADVYRAFDSLADAGRPMIERGEIDFADSPPSQWRGLLRNDLAPAAEAVCPELCRTMERIEAAVGAPVSLTGSGSAMFLLADSVDEAQALARLLPPDLPGRCVIVRPSVF